MRSDAVIFDKDGTLLDFDAFWIAVSESAVNDMLKAIGADKELAQPILCALGVEGGTVDVDSVLCKGTYEEMGEVVHNVLQSHGVSAELSELSKLVTDAYNRNADAGVIRPTSPRLREMLLDLKRRGKRLAVVTTDNTPITEKCLKGLGVYELFDKIYTDDGRTPTKPDPWCVYDFCKTVGVDKERVVMVGDTMTDVRFAENGGIAVVCVARNEKTREYLSRHANAVLDDIGRLGELLS